MKIELMSGTDPAIEEAAHNRVLAAWQVANAFESLSREHRAVIVELYYHHRAVADAARELGVPEAIVKSRAYYALRALRAECQQRGVLP